MAILAVTAFMLTIKSCKKTDNNTVNAKDEEAARAAVIKSIKEKYGNVSAAIIYPLNENAESLSYRNALDNSMTKFNAGAISNAPNGPSLCSYNCNNTTNPNLLHLVYTVQSIQRTYYCQPNSNNFQNDVVVNWQVSVPFTPLVADPNNSSNLSSGYVLITPPLGPIFGSGNITPVVISTIGPDPNCSANTLYKISYSFFYITRDITFTNGYPIDVSLNLYNNCSLVGNLVNSGNVSSTLAGKTAPCDRTDKVYVAGGGPNNCMVVGSSYLTCNPPSGLVLTDLNQVEYRQQDNASTTAWESQGSAINYGQIPFTLTFTASMNAANGFLNLLNMLPGSGTWIVRYRNIKNPTCILIGDQIVPPTSSLVWPGNWVTEVWPL